MQAVRDFLISLPAPITNRTMTLTISGASEQLPDPGRKVLAHYQNDLGKGRTVCAIWVPKNTKMKDESDDNDCDYGENADAYYWAEGWYETIENWDDIGYILIDDPVLYWAELPQWPDPLPTDKEVK